MLDELFDRSYQGGRADLNAGIDRLAARTSNTVLGAFRAGQRIQFSAPWNRRSSGAGCA